MKKILKIVGGLVVIAIVGGFGFLSLSPTLRSDPNVGLSPETHVFGELDVRDFTDKPLGAEVKVFLPMTPSEAMAIVAAFEDYSDWVSPPPENVVIDNSAREAGNFGVGSFVSYKEGETDEIVHLDPESSMVAKPLWAPDAFEGHRGVVIVTPAEGGSIMHMRRYFETTSMQGWMMSKMMPMFMEGSAENLAEIYGGEVL
ncbi:SRPBCC family protein [uncultured Tateyamaria sp.]|uniref:SRPBCC family protein n=1 Tax=uncultured Tateyamaria sp. TaxID=455651 RepID=UPI00263582B8|nr:SRPBCC family protein [uncultured Tateyamaria sp.]